MKKKFLPLLLAAALTASLLPSALAAPTASEEDMAQVLSALDIMTGDQYGDLMLSRNVTRAEFTKLVIAASPLGENVGASTSVSPYPDVPHTSWAAPYVECAVAAGLVKGNLAGYFEPDREITLKEGVTMAVRLLGYADGDFSGAWPTGQMTLYHNLDLDEGISLGPDSPMTRRDALYLFYNLLTAKTKAGQVYLLTLGHTLTPAGEIDRVALVNSAMNGPLVMESGWQSKLSFDPASATVYRDGSLSSPDALQPRDVIYWSKSMHTLWAYSGKVTGLCQAVSPSASSPTAVVVAGKTYPIETADAAYALSNLGPYQVGDTVTLLLGRDGGVAAVASAAAANGTLYGVITAVADSPYTDSSGNSYTAKTVTLAATNGEQYSYPVAAGSGWKAGNLVQVTTANGQAKVERLSQSTLSGKVSSDGAKLGNAPFAANAEILDVSSSGGWVKLYPSRLAGMSLSSDDVKFFLKNADGEIEKLLLNDATGDLYSYGVLTQVQETTNAAFQLAVGAYQYDVGGMALGCVTQGSVFNLTTTGPIQIEGPLSAPTKLTRLKSVKLTAVDALSAVTGAGETFPLWESATFYTLEEDEYRLTSLERVRSGSCSLTGWYDKDAKEGGRIRIVVAKPV